MIGVPLLYSEKIDSLLTKIIEKGDVEDFDDVQYVDLVYPPSSNPPIRHSVKKMSLIGF